MRSYSKELKGTIARAKKLAYEHRHAYVNCEHLLLALADDFDAVSVMRACGADVESLRQSVSSYIEIDMCTMVEKKVVKITPTAGFERVIKLAEVNAGNEAVSGAHALLALFAELEKESHAVYFLEQHNVTLSNITAQPT